jgi:predicted ATPase/class 3 adenylate cyclase
MTDYPRGTVAFLFTDIEGSTRLWQQHRAAMERAYVRHDAVLRTAIADQHGVVYKVIGDAFQAAFPTAEQAVAAALEAQLGLEVADWSELPEPLRVRMALHVGAVDPDSDGDYRSPVLNRLGRLLGAGYGAQILLSHRLAQQVRDRLPEEAGLKDLGAHRLKDLLEPERIVQLLHPGLATDFPPLKSLDVARHNLPIQLTPVIGREREVAELVALLRRDAVRLVTLTGPGGTGKTRLALQSAAEVVEDFADGVWFVSLAALTDPGLLPSAIATVLGVHETGATPVPDLLAEHLRGKRLLLILDNFEQILEAAPVVGGLFAAPGVVVLVTSRAPLHLRGEKEIAVQPLGLPKRKPPPTVEQLSQYAAVRLFIERAQDVRADFTVDAANAPEIAEICHRLDGLPLAIELAAARVKLLSPSAMLARIEQRLPMLTGGARDLPARQQTLRATIAWSYDLLTDDEQKLFRRLSVFAGGWTLEAAEAVAGSPHSGELGLDLFEGLGRLVDHSLVRQVDGVRDEDRFTMLATIREYGLDELTTSGEADEAQQRHAKWFFELAEAAAPSIMIGLITGQWVYRLDREQDNLRAALTWTAAHDPSAFRRLGVALVWFWWLRGYHSEGRRWLDHALTRTDKEAPERAALLDGAGMLAWSQGNDQQADVFHREALAITRGTGDRVGIARALQNLALIAGNLLGNLTMAAPLFREAVTVARAAGDPAWLAVALFNFGSTLETHGDRDGAASLLEEALAVLRPLGLSGLQGLCLTVLAMVWLGRDEPVRAARILPEAITLHTAAGDRMSLISDVGTAAMIAASASPAHACAAIRLFGAGTALREAFGILAPACDQSRFDEVIEETRRQVSLEVATTSWDAGRALSLEEAVVEALALTNAVD